MDNTNSANYSSQYETKPEDFQYDFGIFTYQSTWLSKKTLLHLFGILSSVGMIVGCIMPYVPQYMTIYKNQNCRGFSTYVCLVLLISNILRIVYWFGHPFDLTLIIQSIVQIIAQLLLLEICVRVTNQSEFHPQKKSLSTSFLNNFWRWTDPLSYIEFLCLFTALIGILMYFMAENNAFVETIGYSALLIESVLGIPQLIKNHKNKSIQGLSLGMVLMWLFGDSYKTGYYILNQLPYPFWVCGLTQTSVDVLILFQVCLYRSNATREKDELPKEMVLTSTNNVHV